MSTEREKAVRLFNGREKTKKVYGVERSRKYPQGYVEAWGVITVISHCRRNRKPPEAFGQALTWQSLAWPDRYFRASAGVCD